MKLDVTALRYLSKDDLRVLTAVEMGMKNHEMVPTTLICSISGLRYGGVDRGLRELHKHKLLHHEQRGYDGYRLTNLGYDYLALAALSKRDSITRIGNRLGVGKEADVYHAETGEGEHVVIKIHRLGRTSFRAVKDKRDYHKHRQSASWLYLSRLAATREHAFLKALHEHNFPIPVPIDCNRHIVVMSLVDGYPLTQIRELGDPAKVCNTLLSVAVRLAEHGLVHCDLNEFNILINDDEEVTVIDFPQMVSTSHQDAQEYFQRDVESLYKFFRHKFGLDEEIQLVEYSEVKRTEPLDVVVEASGFGEKELGEFESVIQTHRGVDQEQEDVDAESDSGEDGEAEAGSDLSTRGSGNAAEECIDDEGLRGTLAVTEINGRLEEQTAQPPTSEPTAAVQRKMTSLEISQKVRKQRQKQAKKQASRRNVVKSEAKKKVKSELAEGAFWGYD